MISFGAYDNEGIKLGISYVQQQWGLKLVVMVTSCFFTFVIGLSTKCEVRYDMCYKYVIVTTVVQN